LDISDYFCPAMKLRSHWRTRWRSHVQRETRPVRRNNNCAFGRRSSSSSYKSAVGSSRDQRSRGSRGTIFCTAAWRIARSIRSLRDSIYNIIRTCVIYYALHNRNPAHSVHLFDSILTAANASRALLSGLSIIFEP